MDLLYQDADIVVRVQGPANAGHTVVVGDKKFILHQIPSCILHPKAECVIGNGVVLDPVALFEEIEVLKKLGINFKGRLHISNRAHLVMPYHKTLDQIKETQAAAGKIGTTGRGIGPAYKDKAARIGIRVVDLLKPEQLKAKITANISFVNQMLEGVYHVPEIDADAIVKQYLEYDQQMDEYITDTAAYLHQAVRDGKKIIMEGAQGALLDLDLGTYPYVTSSNTTAGGASTGSGIGPTSIDSVIGIAKAYTTRVGSGPLPTELPEVEGNAIRDKGKEFGATTGRPRRCGWFDAVVVRYACDISGVSELVVTKLDVLDDLPKIKICVRYKNQKYFPADIEILSGAEPIYEDLPGWQTNTSGAKRFEDLPRQAQAYIQRIEKLIGVPVKLISVGAERSQTIQK